MNKAMQRDKLYVTNLITRALRKHNYNLIPIVHVYGDKLSWGVDIVPGDTKAYKDRDISYSNDGRLLDETGKSIMMKWEQPIMEFQAKQIAQHGGDILNVGFGMGYMDDAIEKYKPKSHTIIEIHPVVIAEMKRRGWENKPHVKILHGDWRDFLYKLPRFDGIYIDIWDDDFHDFLAHAPNLLKKDGILTFFNNPSEDHDGDSICDAHKDIIHKNYSVEVTSFEIPWIDGPVRQSKSTIGYWNEEWKTYKSLLLRSKINNE
jgi:SAM-dependent methyltransferase